MHYVMTDAEGRIRATTDGVTTVIKLEEREKVDLKTGETRVELIERERQEHCHVGEGEFTFEFPPEFDFAHQSDWLIVDDELIHDPLPVRFASPVEELQKVQADVDDALCALYELALGGEA